MKANEFNALKKEVKKGNLKGLKKEVVESLTLKQAQALEDLMLDLELNKEGNEILDLVVAFIDNTVIEEKKVANKKAPTKPAEEKKEEKEEKKKAPKNNKTKDIKLTDTIKVGDIVKFRVEGEEMEHPIKIVHIGKNNIIAVMADDEKEVFNIRKTDFNKQVFAWTDRHNEEYNIIVTL